MPFDVEATWADIARVHDPKYANAVKTGKPLRMAQSQGFTWSPDFADAVARIWNGQFAAALLALATGGMVFHPVSGAHHAGVKSGMGFCTLNFLAGAGLRLLREGKALRVGIIDLDAHQGNGTFEWVKTCSGPAHFDISGGDWGVRDVPDWAEYHVVSDSVGYAKALERLGHWLDQTKPQAVLYQPAVDCWEQDRVGGIAGVTADFLSWRDRFVLTHLLEWKIPVVINLGGGYETRSPELHVETARVAVELLESRK